MKLLCLVLLLTSTLCSLRIILQSQPHDSGTVIAKGYTYESESTQRQGITYTNDPGYSMKEDRCPVNEEHPLKNGYVFYEGQRKCEGYVETFQQGFQKQQDNNTKPYENLQFPEKLSELNDFLKLRKADKFEISFSNRSQLQKVDCIFAHTRKLKSQLYSEVKNLQFVVKKSAYNQLYSLHKGHFKETQKLEELAKGKFNRSLIGKGLHQNLVYLITIPKNVDIHQECTLTIEDYLTQSFYLDADQFDNLKAYEVLDIQKPAFTAKQYWYRLTYPLSKITSLSYGYTFSHPIHFRYQQASRTHQYISVTIPKSHNISIQCPDNKTYSFDETYNPATLTTKVPVGLKQSQRMVTFISLIVTVSAALFIDKELSKRQLV